MEPHKTVSMAIVAPGQVTASGEFRFTMQPRFAPDGRTIAYDLTPADAEVLKKALDAFLTPANAAA